MSSRRGVFVALALVACGGRSMTDGPLAQGGESSSGSTSVGGSISLGGTSAGGANAGGAYAGGANAGGANAACLNSGDPQPVTPVTFSLEASQPLWIRYNFEVEYTLSKVCQPTSAPIQPQPQNPCSQTCDSEKCFPCDMSEGVLQLDDPGGPVGPHPSGFWNGYVYSPGTSSSGCACDDRVAARSGTYAITITAYLTPEDAAAQTHGYPFSATFEYPPPDDIVHVKLGFSAL